MKKKDRTYSICIWFDDNKKMTFISGPMSEGEKGISLINLQESSDSEDCVIAKKSLGLVSIFGDLALGMSEKNVEKAKGSPGKKLKDLFIYYFYKLEKFETSSVVEIHFKTKKISAISVSKMNTH